MLDSLPLDELLENALAISDPQARLHYIQTVCGDDQEKFNELTTLVDASQQHSFLDDIEQQRFTPRKSIQIKHRPGQTMGPFVLVKKLGEGGMGEVFLAEQTNPVRRLVALKLILPELHRPEFIAHLEQEYKTLALMEHPGIVRFLDVGVLPNRACWIAMEYLSGPGLMHYCEQKQLSVMDRLNLFVKCCLAVQHCHKKAILHRDIKPSNFVVTEVDSVATPKLIDFGIAKIVNNAVFRSDISNQSTLTNLGYIPGTPAYMSPEQVLGDSSKLDIRSDIYSLGATLSAILTDRAPYSDVSHQWKCLDDIRAAVLHSDPKRPSRIMSDLADHTDHLKRELYLRRAAALAGDLDCIAAKAMSREPDQRYQTVGEMIADVQNYLDQRPVIARSPTVYYQLSRFVKRRRWILIGLAAVSLSIFIGFITTIIWARRAIQSERQLKEESYAADVLLASLATLDHDSMQAAISLRRQIPKAGEEDRRSFDWHLLNRMNRFPSQQIFRNDRAVYFICNLPGSSEIISAGEDAIIRVHDLSKNRIRLQIESGQEEVNGLAVSPDGSLLASAGDDGTVCFWRLSDGVMTGKIQAHKKQAFQAGWSPDGKWLATCGNEEDVQIWSTKDFSKLGSITSNGHDLECVSVSSQGVVAFGAEEGIMTLAKPAGLTPGDGQRQDQMAGTNKIGSVGQCGCLAFSSDGNLIAAGREDGTLRLQSLEGASTSIDVEYRLTSPIRALTFSPDSGRLAAGLRDGSIALFDTSRIQLPGRLLLSEKLVDAEGHRADLQTNRPDDQPHLVKSAPLVVDGQVPPGTTSLLLEFNKPLQDATNGLLYSLVRNRLQNGQPTTEILNPQSVVVQGNTILLSFPLETGGNSNVNEIKGQVRGWQADLSEVKSLCYSSDGRSLVSSHGNGTLHEFPQEEANGVTLAASNVESFVSIMSRELLVAEQGEDVLQLISQNESSRKTPAATWKTGPLKEGEFCLGSNGETLFFVAENPADSRRSVFRSARNQEEREFVWQPTPAESLVLVVGELRPGRLLVQTQTESANGDGGLVSSAFVLIDTSFGRELARVPCYARSNHSQRPLLSSDNQRLIADANEGIRIFDLRQFRVMAEIPSQRGVTLQGYCFSPDSQEIAVAFSDRKIRVFRTSDGRLNDEISQHGNIATDIDWSKDGRTLVTVGFDGRIRFWQRNLLQLTMVYDMPIAQLKNVCFTNDGRALLVHGQSGELYELSID